ncbi:hypothetical protein EQV77_02410 [Halobacillus fulvus]|nr:hypothetical protein EQV77_02410 [Halobacillus fulvus]
MSFKYAPSGEWRKKGSQAWLSICSSVLVLAIPLALNGRVEPFQVYIGIALFLLAIFQVIYFANMVRRDYIRMDEQALMIHRGILDSRKKIRFDQVSEVSCVHDVLAIRTRDGDGEDIYMSRLVDEDRLRFITELEGRINVSVSGLAKGELPPHA